MRVGVFILLGHESQTTHWCGRCARRGRLARGARNFGDVHGGFVCRIQTRLEFNRIRRSKQIRLVSRWQRQIAGGANRRCGRDGGLDLCHDLHVDDLDASICWH